MESKIEKQRQENRRKAPNVADIIDSFEAVFGKVKVLAAEDFETGVKFGEFKEIGVPVTYETAARAERRLLR